MLRSYCQLWLARTCNCYKNLSTKHGQEAFRGTTIGKPMLTELDFQCFLDSDLVKCVAQPSIYFIKPENLDAVWVVESDSKIK